MKELIDLINLYENNNRVEITVSIHSDGSGTITKFYSLDRIRSFDNINELKCILNETD